jgi:hypothetical protein
MITITFNGWMFLAIACLSAAGVFYAAMLYEIIRYLFRNE